MLAGHEIQRIALLPVCRESGSNFSIPICYIPHEQWNSGNIRVSSMDRASHIQYIFLLGVGATAVSDVWQFLLKILFGVRPSNWTLVGRWFSYIPSGIFVHHTISDSEPVRFEAVTGWIAHYAVGIIYAALYLFLVNVVADIGPTFWSALAFGVVTVVAPLFVLHPGMGLGIFSCRAPNPNFVRIHSLSNHLAFGSGLYLADSILSTF